MVIFFSSLFRPLIYETTYHHIQLLLHSRHSIFQLVNKLLHRQAIFQFILDHIFINRESKFSEGKMNLVHNWESFDLFINKGIISEEDLNCVKDKFIKFLYSSLASYHMDRDIREDVCDII